MEVRQLRYFLQVYRDGSILRAARNISISQQALSKAITSLEQEVGVPLFRRTARGLIPTETGELLCELAQPVVDSMDALLDQISVSAKLNNLQFTLGISQGLEHFVRPNDFDRFCAQNPTAHVTVEEHAYDVCESLVENGSMTMALISGPVQNPRLVAINLLHRRRVVLMRRDNPLAKKDVIHISDLKGFPLVLNINNRCYKTFCALCRGRGFEPSVHRVGDTSTVYDLCKGQGYVGVSIDFILQRFWRSYPDVVARPVDFHEFSYPIDLIISPSQYNRKIVRVLVDHVCQAVQAIHEEDMQDPDRFPFQP